MAVAYRRKNPLERVQLPSKCAHTREPTFHLAAPPRAGEPTTPMGGMRNPTYFQWQPWEAPYPRIPPAFEKVETCSIAVGLDGAGLGRWEEIVSNTTHRPWLPYGDPWR